ncbi:MAG: tetratricopeptide repeat protein [Porphyromonadaceae bacterium]|jgi:tetratricopeptide (TPR) repeat protein|nr:tetratricopeptide repeat protein [uncultured Macellibacteroides sp.]MCE5227141.1 tetratricopeptide repeat protein [Porphyromonadaceae bacterium]
MLKQIISSGLLLLVLAGGSPILADNTKKGAPSKPVQQDNAQQRKLDYFFYEGVKLKNAGKFDAAFDLFSHCLEIDSTASPVLYELSSFYVEMNKPEKAVGLLQRAVNYAPDNFTYRMALASVSRGLGMFSDASAEYQTLIDKFPDKTDLNYYLAESLTQEGEISKAIEAYDALENSVGMNEAISIQKYKLYNTLNEPEKAMKEIQKLADKYPMEARYQIVMGDLYLEKNDTDKALLCYNKAHEIDPSNPYYIVSMANYYEIVGDKEAAETQIRSALVNNDLDVDTKVNILSRYVVRLQQNKQDIEGANTLFKTLLEQHPEETELKLMYGSLLAMQDKTEEARFQFQLVTEMEPDNAGAWQQLLNLSLKADNMEEVKRICLKCQELFPNAPEYYFYLGIAHYQLKEYDKALETYQAGIRIIDKENTSQLSDFYGQIGDIYYQQKNLTKAYEAYEEALKYNDKNIVVLNNYSYFLTLDKKDLKKAERMSAQCIKLQPDNSTYLDTYAWVFFTQGNYTLAKIYIENAISKDSTNSSELADHYGDILYMNGEKEKALEQWKKAKELGKQSETLDRKIAEQIYIEEVIK